MVSVQARSEQVSYAIDRGLSQRVACALLKISRSNLYYSHKMPVKDATVIEVMKKLSGLYPRFGSRRIRIFYREMASIQAKNDVVVYGLKLACRCLESAEVGRMVQMKVSTGNSAMSVCQWNGSVTVWKQRW